MECSIGIFKEEVCHILSYSRHSTLNNILEYSEEVKRLLSLRTGCQNINTVCTYHEKKFVDKFTHLYGTSCCDPFSDHKKIITKTLRKINIDLSTTNPSLNLIPGKALCSKCFNKIHSKSVKNVQEENDNYDIYEPECVLVESVNEACSALGVSPVKVAKLSFDAKSSAVKKKITNISETVKHKLSKSFDLNISGTDEDFSLNVHCNDLSEQYVTLIDNLKEKMKIAESFQEKVNILSLLPSTWSCVKVQKEFGVSQYLVRKTRDLVKKQGVLPKVEPKHPSNVLDNNTIKTVQEFYQSDENSRMMPGRKDCVSVIGEDGIKTKIQKMLILCNLKELYEAFKGKHPDMKIGFSKFAELRPRFCVLAGACGTHAVCVCLYHQNVKLMLSAIKTQHSYKDLLKLMVCDTESETCMLSECPNCPGSETAIKMVKANVGDDGHLDEEMKVSFKQWTSTDSCELTSCVMPIYDYLEKLEEKLENLKHHHFVSKKQAEYLASRKEGLSDGDFLVLGDFSENFSFVLQDEIQSYHWSKQQATLHPFVVYWKSEGKVQTQSYCLISDCMNHNTSTFYVFQKTLVENLKADHPNISKIIYFSDGSAAQYKNRKNFINLAHHKQDFGIASEWHFFATSHGKSPCDGIGGTVKRLVRKASLQRPVSDQINNPTSMYEYCCGHIPGIRFYFCSCEEIETVEKTLDKRFQMAQAVPQTRNFHCFIPISKSMIQAKQTSQSQVVTTFQITRDVLHNHPKLSDYVCCIYDDNWWLGEVMEVKVHAIVEEYRIHFFHPNGPGTSFKKSNNDNRTWVQFQDILRILTPNELWSPQGRGHNITPLMSENLSMLLNERINK